MEQPILPFVNQYKKYTKTIAPFIQNPKTKNYSTVIFFFLVLSVFGWYAIKPTIQTILYLRREIKDKTEVDKKMNEKIYALIEANNAYENSQTLLSVLSEAIPTSPEALDLVSQMNALAASKNVVISSLKMSDIPLASPSGSSQTKNAERFTKLPIDIDVEGSYLAIVSFLRELISLRRIVTLEVLNFSSIKPIILFASESGKQASLKVVVHLLTYYETQ